MGITDAITLIDYLVKLGVTLSEDNLQKIRDGVAADLAAADAETARSESLDAPQDPQR